MDIWSKSVFPKDRFINMIISMGKEELIDFSVEQEEQYLGTLIERDILIEFLEEEGYDVDKIFREVG